MALACGLQDAAWGQRWKEKSNFLITRRWLRLSLLVASRTSRAWGCRKSVVSIVASFLHVCYHHLHHCPRVINHTAVISLGLWESPRKTTRPCFDVPKVR
jgi:hypothetical protein